MGIGAAFATGLVKGFTQNIQEEKARRLAEQQKIDAFEQTALQSALTGKTTKSGRDSVAKLIKSARQDMKERPDIDIFGRATDAIDIDFSGIQTALEDTEDFNYKISGASPESFIGFSRGTGKGSLADARAHLQEYQTLIADPSVQAKLRKDPVLAKNLQLELSAQQAVIVSDALQKHLEGGKNKRTTFQTPNIFGIQANSGYLGLATHNELMAELNIAPTSVVSIYNTAVSSVSGGQANQLPGQKVVAHAVEPVRADPNDPNSEITGYTIGSLNIPEEKMPLYTGVAKALGMPASPQADSSMTLYEYWTGVDENGMQIPGNKQYFDFLGMGVTEKQDALSASLQLATYPGIASLDPEQALSRLSYDDRGDDEVLKFSAKLGSTKANTFEQKVMALAPFMTFDREENSIQIYGYTPQDGGITKQMYVLRKRHGDLANTTEKTSFAYMQEELSNKEEALNSLVDLQNKRKKLDDVETYARFKRFLKVAFVGEGSVVDGIKNDLLGLGVTSEQTADLSADFLKSLDDSIKSKGSTELAELEAMRISLAFQLARAADPSGRLSNQDIQQQLARLGEGFLTKEEAVAKIGVVIAELKRDVGKMKVLVKYGQGQTVLSPNEAKIIDAAFAVDYVENRAAALRQRSGVVAAGGALAIRPDDYTIFSDGSIMDNDLNTITDPTTINAIKKAKGLKI